MRSTPKLTLTKETVRRLSDDSAQQVAGGLTMTCHVTQCDNGCIQDPPPPGTLSGKWCSFAKNCQTLFSYCGTC